jgi:hypothetical protein
MNSALKPTSSCASRKAAITASASVSSTLPPGKAICPEWLLKWLVRWVSKTVGCSRSMMAMSTEACTIGLSVKRGSPNISGDQSGGLENRWRKAAACNCAGVTAGKW